MLIFVRCYDFIRKIFRIHCQIVGITVYFYCIVLRDNSRGWFHGRCLIFIFIIITNLCYLNYLNSIIAWIIVYDLIKLLFLIELIKNSNKKYCLYHKVIFSTRRSFFISSTFWLLYLANPSVKNNLYYAEINLYFKYY